VRHDPFSQAVDEKDRLVSAAAGAAITLAPRRLVESRRGGPSDAPRWRIVIRHAPARRGKGSIQLAERRALAADDRHVVETQIVEPADVGVHGVSSLDPDVRADNRPAERDIARLRRAEAGLLTAVHAPIQLLGHTVGGKRKGSTVSASASALRNIPPRQ
jgi:hypothetical protein